MSTGDTSSEATLRQLLVGHRATHLLYVAAELGLADLLANGPHIGGELAQRSGAHADALHWILRALVQLDVFAEREDGRFTLAPLGEYLRTDHPQSLRTAARVCGHETHTRQRGAGRREHVGGHKGTGAHGRRVGSPVGANRVAAGEDDCDRCAALPHPRGTTRVM